MTTESRLSAPDESGASRWFPLPVVLCATAFGAAAGTLVIALHGPLAATIGTGVAVAALCTVRARGVNIWRLLFMRLALRWRNRRRGDVGQGAAAFDAPVPDSDVKYGMRWEDGCLITMLQMEPRVVAPTLLSPKEIRTVDPIPLDEVARCLSQFDIRLAAIDVVALGVRTSGGHEAVRIYERMLGPLPATAVRTVWLVLRFDPQHNADAIGNRGGGPEGAARAMVIATRRVINRLARHRVRARALTAAELAAAETAVRGEDIPGDWRESWQALHRNDFELAGYAIHPDRLTTEALAGIWAVPGNSTMVRLRVSRSTAPGAREDPAGRVAITGLVRHDTVGPVPDGTRKMLSELGLQPLPGVQRRVLLEGGQHAAVGYGAPAALSRLTVPAGGTGQVIGATEDGFGVAVPLFGPGVRRVDIVGGLLLAQQATVRAMALGARVVVHSSRPEGWAPLAAQVGRPEVLSVSYPGGGAQHTAAATLIVYDGISSAGQLSEATVVHVRAAGDTDETAAGVDVALIAATDGSDRVHIRTSAGEYTVRMVSIPDELRYLAGERVGVPAAAAPRPSVPV
ncbi:type VII secretion protein EccE [Nocardia macrotermitis]|uniref:type VII secretion protein EccE n=1 Tax=Nocardia macrotermitis TaxID=2585198 RepID=UPI001885B59D|nr:type VII secretion protein EccE [Nocardia macrotermitis]